MSLRLGPTCRTDVLRQEAAKYEGHIYYGSGIHRIIRHRREGLRRRREMKHFDEVSETRVSAPAQWNGTSASARSRTIGNDRIFRQHYSSRQRTFKAVLSM
jgi:hypothetical protein